MLSVTPDRPALLPWAADYVDRDVPMLLRMFEGRLRAYRAPGYARGDLIDNAVATPERTIGYDEELLEDDDTR